MALWMRGHALQDGSVDPVRFELRRIRWHPEESNWAVTEEALVFAIRQRFRADASEQEIARWVEWLRSHFDPEGRLSASMTAALVRAALGQEVSTADFPPWQMWGCRSMAFQTVAIEFQWDKWDLNEVLTRAEAAVFEKGYQPALAPDHLRDQS